MNNPVYWIDPSGLTAFTVRNALHHSNSDSGRYTLYVRPRWADNVHMAVGVTPSWPTIGATLITETFMRAIGYRTITTDWWGLGSEAISLVDDVRLGIIFNAANIAQHLIDDSWRAQEAVFNHFRPGIFNSNTREGVATGFGWPWLECYT